VSEWGTSGTRSGEACHQTNGHLEGKSGPMSALRARAADDIHHAHVEVTTGLTGVFQLTRALEAFIEWDALYPIGTIAQASGPRHHAVGGLVYFITKDFEVDIRAGGRPEPAGERLPRRCGICRPLLNHMIRNQPPMARRGSLMGVNGRDVVSATRWETRPEWGHREFGDCGPSMEPRELFGQLPSLTVRGS
jgi:hypothetical protein